jgi:hypothetical protein
VSTPCETPTLSSAASTLAAISADGVSMDTPDGETDVPM